MSKKEKNLVYVVVALAFFAVFWLFVYTPMDNRILDKQGEVLGLTTQLDQLKALYQKKDVYEAEIAEMKTYIDTVETKFPGDMTQEMVIYTMINLENQIESLRIPGYVLYPSVVVASDGEFIPENSDVPIFRENFIEVGTELSLETTYEDLKLMLAYFRDYPMELSLENLSLVNNLETSLVTSSFTLNYYALRSLDRPFIPENYFGPFDPKDNSIFSPYEGYGTLVTSAIELAELIEPDDFIMNLSSIDSDRTTVVIFKNGDRTNDTYVYTDNNGNEPVEIVFEVAGTNYYYRYKTSKESYPSTYTERIAFTPGKTIDVKVYVEPRTNADDKSGVNAVLVNSTDLPLNVRVVGDEANNPRFNITSQTGNVVVTQVGNE